MIAHLGKKEPQYKVIHESKDILRMQINKKALLKEAGTLLFGFASFYGGFYYFAWDSLIKTNHIFLFGVGIALLIPLYLIANRLYKVLINENILLDHSKDLISKNGKTKSQISQIKYIEIQANSNNDRNDEYKLFLMTQDKKKNIKIEQGREKDEIYALANELARFLNLQLYQA